MHKTNMENISKNRKDMANTISQLELIYIIKILHSERAEYIFLSRSLRTFI